VGFLLSIDPFMGRSHARTSAEPRRAQEQQDHRPRAYAAMGGRNHFLLTCCVCTKRLSAFLCDVANEVSAHKAVLPRWFVRSQPHMHVRIAFATTNVTDAEGERPVPCSYFQRGHTFVCVGLLGSCRHGRHDRCHRAHAVEGDPFGFRSSYRDRETRFSRSSGRPSTLCNDSSRVMGLA
jgi:hypothetical protein